MNKPNYILKGDGYYISYNAIDIDVYGSDTTAIVLGNMEKFYILCGDHRDAYINLMKIGIEACLEYFITSEEKHKFSDKLK